MTPVSYKHKIGILVILLLLTLSPSCKANEHVVSPDTNVRVKHKKSTHNDEYSQKYYKVALQIGKTDILRTKCNSHTEEEKKMQPIADLITWLRADEENDYYRYEHRKTVLDSCISNGEPNCFALNYLQNVLKRKNEHISLQLLDLLHDIADKTDPFNRQIAKVAGYSPRLIRDPTIIEILIKQLLTRDGEIRQKCEEMLYSHVPPNLLLPHAETCMKSFERRNLGSLLKIISKAKPDDSLERMRSVLSKRNKLALESSKIALAALGDEKLEQELIRSFQRETDPYKKKAGGLQMARIGTPASLYALAGELRSPLIFSVPSAFKKSIRLDFLKDLQFGFPTTEIYYRPILKDEDYIEVENYVEKELGVTWTQERPNFLTSRPYPAPRR